MIYLFEDKYSVLTSHFIHKSYSDKTTVSFDFDELRLKSRGDTVYYTLVNELIKPEYKDLHKIIFTSGNSELIPCANAILISNELKDEEIAIFFDLSIRNKVIYKLYRDITDLYNNNSKRVVPVPIICSEYNTLKAFDKLKLNSKYTKDLETVLELDIYFKTQLYEKEKDRIKTFEKFCKRVAYYIESEQATDSDKYNFEIFFRKGDIVHDNIFWCWAKRYLENWYVLPGRISNVMYKTKAIDLDYINKNHKLLVEKYNEATIRYLEYLKESKPELVNNYRVVTSMI